MADPAATASSARIAPEDMPKTPAGAPTASMSASRSSISRSIL
jgi:hypothetical protein